MHVFPFVVVGNLSSTMSACCITLLQAESYIMEKPL